MKKEEAQIAQLKATLEKLEANTGKARAKHSFLQRQDR